MNDEAYADDTTGALAREGVGAAEQPDDIAPQDNPYDFDAAEAADPNPKEIAGIKWRGRDYVLCRASADDVIRFTNARMRCARITHEENNPQRTITPVGGAELPYLLVSMCLFMVRKTADGKEQRIPMPQEALRSKGANSWPPHIIDKLYEDAKRISYIDTTPNPSKRLVALDRERKKLLEQIRREAGSSGGGNGEQALVEVGVNGAAGEDPVGN